MPESTDGPFVNIACICQSPIQEVTGQLSIFRIMDRIQVAGTMPTMQPQPIQNLFMVIILRSGSLRESYNLKIVGYSPSGATLTTTENSVLFEGEERGPAVISPLAIVATEPGLYWFDVSLEGRPLTRVPLRVQYQRIQGLPLPFQPPSS
jgi:hypothetical protein